MYMLKKEVEREFKDMHPNYKTWDIHKRRLAWDIFTDGLYKDNRIKFASYNNWIRPSFIESK